MGGLPHELHSSRYRSWCHPAAIPADRALVTHRPDLVVPPGVALRAVPQQVALVTRELVRPAVVDDSAQSRAKSAPVGQALAAAAVAAAVGFAQRYAKPALADLALAAVAVAAVAGFAQHYAKSALADLALVAGPVLVALAENAHRPLA